jgi:hypothetical protein
MCVMSCRVTVTNQNRIKEMDLPLTELPNDPNILKNLINDLNRRLENSSYVLIRQKEITSHLTKENERIRQQNHLLEIELNKERNKTELLVKKTLKEKEYLKYEENKKKSEKMHEDLRLALIDHKISNTKKEPNRLIRLRKQLEEIDKSQTSQKQLLVYFSIQERMIEDLTSLAQEGNLDGCRNMIRRGVNINEMNSSGLLPIHYACSSGHLEVVKLLLEFGSDSTSYLTGFSPLYLAAERGYPEIIRLLISYGVNVNETGWFIFLSFSDSRTGLNMTPPIVAAAKNGHISAVECLLDQGAQINAQDIDGNTALHTAAKLEKPVAMLRMLLLRGANPKINNGVGHTPLQVEQENLVSHAHISRLP